MQLTRLFDPETVCECCIAAGGVCHGCDVAQRKDSLLWSAQQIVAAACSRITEQADALFRAGVLSAKDAVLIAEFEDKITAIANPFARAVLGGLGEELFTED